MREEKLRDLEEYLAFDHIEIVDDDDKAAVEATINELNNDEDIVPDETPLYIQGPGFDDCLSPEEINYIRQKHSNIVLVDNISKEDSDDQTLDSVCSNLDLSSSLAEAEEPFQKIADEAEQTETQSRIKQLAAIIENYY